MIHEDELECCRYLKCVVEMLLQGAVWPSFSEAEVTLINEAEVSLMNEADVALISETEELLRGGEE